MPSLSAIETALAHYVDGRPQQPDGVEWMLYDRMHTGIGPMADKPAPDFALAHQWVARNTLSGLSPWQGVCFSWVLRDLLWHVADARLSHCYHELHQTIVRQGQAALLTGQTGLLDGSALYLNYLIEHNRFSMDDGSASLVTETAREIMAGQVRPLFHPPNHTPIDLSTQPGLIGLLLTLLRLADEQTLPDSLTTALHDVVKYVAQLAQPIDYFLNQYSFFPGRVHLPTQEYDMHNSLSWATGDLGVVLMLYRAARCFNDQRLHKLAESVGTFTLIRDDVATTEIDTPWFLHGSVGTAVLYDALRVASGNERYRKGQQYWTDRTIQWLATYPVDTPAALSGGLLHGYAGVLLALHTLDGNCRPDWKRLFLL